MFLVFKIVGIAEVNECHCDEDSGQQFGNVDRTHLVLASGKIALPKSLIESSPHSQLYEIKKANGNKNFPPFCDLRIRSKKKLVEKKSDFFNAGKRVELSLKLS